jgi:hypothetical protein
LKGYSEPVTYRDEKEVVDILMRIARKEGQQLGSMARMLVRQGLRARDDLTTAERRILEGTGGFGASVEEARALRHE